MRNLSATALAKIAAKTGNEPIFIVEVDWGDTPVAYADRATNGIPGRILQVSDLDNVIGVSGGDSSAQISITLDDAARDLHALIKTRDVHQRNARVYQWFEGLDIADKFLLFAGKVSSPVVWSEGERTFSFTIVSQLEDREFGFSAEEGEFPLVPKELVGKPWPVIFGKCLDVPALRINQAVSGSTLCGVGIISGEALHNQVAIGGTDCGLGMALAHMSIHRSFLFSCLDAFRGIDNQKAAEILDQINELSRAMSASASQKIAQEQCAANQRQLKLDNAQTGLGCNPVRILGGEDFPQNTTIVININGGLFTGIMRDDEFTISHRSHPDNEAKAQAAFDGIGDSQCETPTPLQKFDFQMTVPGGKSFFGSTPGNNTIRRHGYIVCNTPQKSRPGVQQVAQHFWADAGSRVVIHGNEPITYIVSITPGTVLAVKAFKTLNSERKLVNVPNNLWSVQTTVYGTLTAVEIVISKALSTLVDQGWDDQIYVTFESTIGPDTVEILEWIVDNYTDLEYDTASFEVARTALASFPSNFPVLDRKNTVDLIKEIAFQARCAVWLSNGVFYLKYLPEEPASDQTVTVSDIEFGSVEVELTNTEELITKMIVTWHLSWADEEPPRIILKNNVDKYGVKPEEFDWYIYNQPDIVLKAATFWLIRFSNTWKRLRFRGFLNLLKLETFDTVTVPAYASDAAVKAVVEKADYDSESNTMAFECLTPVRSGEPAEYKFFWPSALNVTDTYPSPGEGDAASGVTGELPIGFTDGIGQGGTVFVGGPNVVFRTGSGRGDRTPTDVGFVAQTIIPGTVFANVDNTANPRPDLSLTYIDPIRPPPQLGMPAASTVIDIRTTKIIDSDNPGTDATLDSIIKDIQGADLVIRTDSKFGDDDNTEEFDFEFDDEGNKFGAGTAFLKEDD